MSNEPTSNEKASRGVWLPDFLASTVVFLVALPLCIGIAVACGVPAERGLVTGIIGGIAVGFFSGAPLLVSGPAASLIVPVVDLIQTHGLVALAPVVVMAGLWQVIAGVLRLGQWFRAVAPAVIVGMLVGIGLLILASQLHVSVDAPPRASFIENLIYFPQTLFQESEGHSRFVPLLISTATIGLIVVWDKLKPKSLSLVPGQLVSLVLVTAAAHLVGASVAFLDISPRFFDGLAVPQLGDFERLLAPNMIGLSLMFAFIASAATLLTANAIDQRQTRSKTNYDKEMFAQGIGNMLTGAVGGLPMTGVIVRSSVNVDAGAQTRRSTILHGIWILLFVSAAPEVLELIPRASLGAILVYTGYRLIDRRSLALLYKQGRSELAICLITLFGVVFIDLFVGIMAGLGAAIGKIVYTFAKLEIRSEPNATGTIHELHLTGSATFLQLPRLATELESVPDDRELHVHIDQLDHIDHACLELLSSWDTRRTSEGKPGMVVEWDELTERYRRALVGAARGEVPDRSIMNTIWAEWKRIYAPSRRPQAPAGPEVFIDQERVRLQIDARSLGDVVEAAAEALANAADRPAPVLRKALDERIEGHVALGGGISVPHTPIEGLEHSIAALVTTAQPVDVGTDRADLFFVLLAPAGAPRKHLQALAHVGRLCHDQGLLDGLREATFAPQAARLLRAAERGDYDTGAFVARARLLAAVEVEDPERVAQLARMVDEAFGRSASGSGRTEPIATVRRALNVPSSSHYVLVTLVEHDVPVLLALLDEESRVVGGSHCPVHLLRPESLVPVPPAQPETPQAEPSA